MSNSSDQNHLPLYQVDYSVKSSGKTVAITKRRISWRFGYANPTALKYGASGVDCRGSEHDVSLVWSIASGKKTITQDGKEVYFSQGRRAEGRFQHSWQSKQHVYTVIAHVAPPLGKSKSDWKQFEFLIDGCSFSNLHRIYELGSVHPRNHAFGRTNSAPMPSSKSLHKPQRISSAPLVHNSAPYERRSDRDNHRVMNDEFSFANSGRTIVTKRHMNTTPRSTSPEDSITPQDLLAQPSAVTIPPQDLLSQSVDAPSRDPFSYQGEADQFNPHQPPSHEAIWSSIMNAYDSGTINENKSIDPTYVSVTEIHSDPLHVDTVFEKRVDNQPVESPTDVCALDGAMNNLVNLDDISQPVLKEFSQNTRFDNKSNISLSELRKPTKTLSRDIMKSHHFPVHVNTSSALVVFGQSQQQNPNNCCPPPLSYGFGVPNFR